MTEEFRSRLDPTRRLAGPHDEAAGDAADPPPDDADETDSAGQDAFSMVSADRRQKAMLELRFKNGNAKALAYSYLVSIDFDPSKEIRLDFSDYDVHLSGRNLAPLFAGLVAQRVAWVQEVDELHAEAVHPPGATVVSEISVTEHVAA